MPRATKSLTLRQCGGVTALAVLLIATSFLAIGSGSTASALSIHARRSSHATKPWASVWKKLPSQLASLTTDTSSVEHGAVPIESALSTQGTVPSQDLTTLLASLRVTSSQIKSFDKKDLSGIRQVPSVLSSLSSQATSDLRNSTANWETQLAALHSILNNSSAELTLARSNASYLSRSTEISNSLLQSLGFSRIFDYGSHHQYRQCNHDDHRFII